MGTQSNPAPRGRTPEQPPAGVRRSPAARPTPRGWRGLVDEGLASAGDGLGRKIRGFYQDLADHRAEKAAGDQRKYGRTLFVGTSRENGRTARVLLYSDRVERMRTRSISSLVGVVQDNEVTPVRSITSVKVRRENLLISVVTVFASANAITFRMSHNEARSFRDALTKLVLRGSADQPSAPRTAVPRAARPDAAPGPDALDQLRRLGELRDLGVISEEEFASKKTELLRRV